MKIVSNFILLKWKANINSIIYQILFLFIFSTCLLAQNMRSPSEIELDGSGTWQEVTNLDDPIIFYVEYDFPTEFGFYLGQSSLEYRSTMLFTRVDVRYDNGDWITLLNSVGSTTGEFIPPWNNFGTHTMDIQYWNIGGLPNLINNIVYVIPPRNKGYADGLGNWVSGWTGTTTAIDRPVIIIEGFDPLNITWPDFYYGKASNWLNRIRNLDADVLIFNFNEGGTDLVANAHIIQGFARYIEVITVGSEKIILAGLSMGGPIARYALAEAEAQGIPLYVSHFLSIDGPQQDAIMPRDFLDYIKDHDEGIPHPELNSVAAKQMLRYNPYDPGNYYHTSFYNVLNNLNGDGYPHNCTNIGVSFAPNITNPNLGEWLEVEIEFGANQHFYLWEENECLVPGSYLPLSATNSQGVSWFLFLQVNWNLVRKKHPTYIPYVSALDIVNGESKFDETLNSSENHFHVEFPEDLVDPVSTAIGLLPDSYADVTFRNVIDNVQEDDAEGLLLVTDNSGTQTQVSSGGTVSVSLNNDNIVETLDRYRLNFSGTGINYQQKYWNDELDEYKVKHTFKGWKYNRNQKAYFSELDKVTVKNSLEGTSLSIGNVDFKDPWYKIGENQPNQFQTFSSPFTPGEGNNASYGGVFLDQDYNDPGTPYYSVKVPGYQDINLGGSIGIHRFYFQNWSGTDATFQDANNNETPVVFTSSNATASAVLKGIGLSNNQNAYGTGSQRKFVELYDGTLFSIYQSLGKVWLERSIDNGQNWTLWPNNLPFESSNEYSTPSIDWIPWTTPHSFAAIVSGINAGTYSVELKVDVIRKDQIIPPYSENIGLVGSDHPRPPFTPVIAVTEHEILVVCNSGTEINGSGEEGLVYFYGSISESTVNVSWVNKDNPLKIPGSTYNSKNPTIMADKDGSTFHIAWEEGNNIKYCNAAVSGQDITFSSVVTPSAGTGYTQNYAPSILVMETDNLARLCWVGKRYVCQGNPEIDCDGTFQYKVLFKGLNNLTRHWSFGGNNGNIVSSPNINKKNNNTNNPYYAFGWYESSGENKFADNTLSTVRTLNTVGQRVQICNGTEKDNMYAMSFNYSSQPYFFQVSNSLGSFYTLQKIQHNVFSSGREGIVSIDSADFYFALGDIEIDGQSVDFVEIADTIQISSLSLLNEYLISEPINVSDGSSFIYSVQYGINDSLSAVAAMIDNRYVKFNVQLINDNTEELIATYDNVTYNSENIYNYGNISYQINTQGIGNITVRLRLIVENNFVSDYSLAKIYSDDSVLGKTNVRLINFNGNEVITSYSLSQNYPNPFNPTTTIKYQIPKAGNVTLKVYDVLGSEVTTLVDEVQSEGRYEVSFNASSLASGVYIYRLQASDYTSVKKMILMK